MGDRPHQGFFSSVGLDSVLQLYRPGMSFFGSAQGAVLASGEVECTTVGALRSKLAGYCGALPVLAAVPFDVRGMAHVLAPDQACLLKQGGDVPKAVFSTQNEQTVQRAACLRGQEPSPLVYQQNVAMALENIRAHVFDKVVLARSLMIEADMDLKSLLSRMLLANPTGYTFAFELGADRPRTLIGASPELLLAKRGRTLMSNPLAGSIPHAADPLEDAERAQGLLRSEKDLREHALVVDAVVKALRPHCLSMDVPQGPALLSTPTMWHLSTEIRAELRNPYASSLDLALALHPTPAVCGYPEQAARDFILEHEGFERGLFTGLVGWSGAGGDGEWAITIRCAEVEEGHAKLYAGAGIVEGSDPALELAETSAKLRTMLRLMGLESVLEA